MGINVTISAENCFMYRTSTLWKALRMCPSSPQTCATLYLTHCNTERVWRETHPRACNDNLAHQLRVGRELQSTAFPPFNTNCKVKDEENWHRTLRFQFKNKTASKGLAVQKYRHVIPGRWQERDTTLSTRWLNRLIMLDFRLVTDTVACIYGSVSRLWTVVNACVKYVCSGGFRIIKKGFQDGRARKIVETTPTSDVSGVYFRRFVRGHI